jgi:hypothetical protein
MITNFENITYDLTDTEKELLPIIITGFLNYTEKNPIKEPDIVARFNERNKGKKLSGVRLRKLVNVIRSNGLLPLIATSKGYYVSHDKEVILSQIKSLRQRAKSINDCADGLLKFT